MCSSRGILWHIAMMTRKGIFKKNQALWLDVGSDSPYSREQGSLTWSSNNIICQSSKFELFIYVIFFTFNTEL